VTFLVTFLIKHGFVSPRTNRMPMLY